MSTSDGAKRGNDDTLRHPGLAFNKTTVTKKIQAGIYMLSVRSFTLEHVQFPAFVFYDMASR